MIVIATIATLQLFVDGCDSRRRIQSNSDAIYNDLSNIAAHAYMYRVRSSPTYVNQSYAGYVIPEKMRSNENGDYFAEVISADTLKLVGRSRTNSQNTITVFHDKDGKSSPRVYTGDFR
jgi:outer membrane lipoprotein-sorting protein